MITEAILNVVFSFFNILVGFFPTISLPADMISYMAQVFGWVGWVNYYIPLETVWSGILIVVATWFPSAIMHLFLSLF